jgi:Tfp pilus assembly protein PilF
VAPPVTAAAANYYLGRIAIDLLQWSEAERCLDRAILIHPDYADAYAALGSVYLKEKDFTRADQALSHALKIDPDNYQANLNLMTLYLRSRDPRADAQSRRFAQLVERKEKAKMFLRNLRIVP